MQVPHVQAAVIASVRALFPQGGGGGYKNMYHLFLRLGQDMCFGPDDCYSPDNPDAFTFCAYHASMDTTDAVGKPLHVVYSVMPFQNVSGCDVISEPFPNGKVADSTNTTLSHEIFEAITDPDSDAWYVTHSALSGSEIGDLCSGDDFQLTLNGRPYLIQLEYDNATHSCNSVPSP